MQAVITGGAGATAATTPEALLPLFDERWKRFGELFRMVSYEEIGTAAIQSRARWPACQPHGDLRHAGLRPRCRTAWELIIEEQLDARHRPCNFSPI
ncbi:molybdopterin-binding protein [Serratia ureilytica]